MSSLLLKNVKPTLKTTTSHVRGMATEKQILGRIMATSNIAKITKSMKMVSAAKMRGAEQRLNSGRPYAMFLENLGAKERTVEEEGVVPAEELGEKENTFVVISTDRGLCGGCNSHTAKTTKKQVAQAPEKSSIVVVGDKARSQLHREHGKHIQANVTEAYANHPNFAVASGIAEAVLGTAKADDANFHVIYNKYKSAIAYFSTIRSLKVNPTSDAFESYELEPDNKEDVLADLREFELASAIFHGIVENCASEESSRMSAMENATTNAEELISTLTLQYNKARQARITTELIEIISGAASLDG